MNKDQKALRKAVASWRTSAMPAPMSSWPAWTVERGFGTGVDTSPPRRFGEARPTRYRNAVYNHLIPGLGAHRLDKVRPEHFERLYAKMQRLTTSPATFTRSTARPRPHSTRQSPTRLRREERGQASQEPATHRNRNRAIQHRRGADNSDQASQTRHAARWAIALVLGLRQGEVLGLRWKNIDLDQENLMVHRNRLRPEYEHGCTKPCGKKAGFCPNRVKTNDDIGEVKSTRWPAADGPPRAHRATAP